jgi:hypothetical protein
LLNPSQGHADDELPENMLFVVYMSHVNLDEIGEDLVVDDVLRDVERRKSAASVQASPSSASSIPVVVPPEEYANSLSSPRLSAASQPSASTTAVQAGLHQMSLQSKAVAAPAAEENDDEFHEADEEFYDAES